MTKWGLVKWALGRADRVETNALPAATGLQSAWCQRNPLCHGELVRRLGMVFPEPAHWLARNTENTTISPSDPLCGLSVLRSINDRRVGSEPRREEYVHVGGTLGELNIANLRWSFDLRAGRWSNRSDAMPHVRWAKNSASRDASLSTGDLGFEPGSLASTSQGNEIELALEMDKLQAFTI
jgi:hypothetical protein